MSGLSTFSKVNVDQLDLDEYPELKEDQPAPAGGAAGGMPPGGMPGGMPGGFGGMGMDGMGMDGMEGGIGGMDFDEWKTTACEERDVGKTFDCTQDRSNKVTKKVLAAGGGYDNPRKGWEADVLYVARQADGTLLDASHESEAHRIVVGSDELPKGLEKAVITMRVGEKVEVMVAAEVAGGSCSVMYTLSLVQIFEVARLSGGDIIKTTRTKPSENDYESPQPRAEVSLRWSGKLEDGTLFQAETEATVVVGDESRGEQWWTPALGSFRKGEACELTVLPRLAYGDEGCPALGVPPGATLRLTVAVVDWVSVEDVSEASDGSALKRLLSRGEGWERPLEGYEAHIDYELRDEAGTPMATRQAYVLTVGAHMPASQSAELRAGAGGAEVEAVLCKLVKGMAKGEQASLTCAAGYLAGGSGGALSLHVSLRGWSKVEPVPHTGGCVVRKVVSEPVSEYERPNEGAICKVRFVVRTLDGTLVEVGGGGVAPEAIGGSAGTADEDEPNQEAPKQEEAVSFEQGDVVGGLVLPCIDAAVRELKRGEIDLISAPAAWAYGADGFGGEGKPVASDVHVELQLVDFERAKEPYELELPAKLGLQEKKKEQGNVCFKRGELERALKLYQRSNSVVQQSDLSDSGERSEAEVAATTAASSKVTLSCHLNSAMCHLKLADLPAAIKACDAALLLEPASLKALLRRGQAQRRKGDLDEAKADLMAAAKLDPKSREVRAELEELKVLQSAQRAKDKNVFGGMFK